MQAPKKPANEAERLAALRSYEVMDSAGEIEYDDIAKLAAYICGTPIALVTLVDDERQWFKAQVGIDASIRETARDISFCGHIVFDGNELVVNDATEDVRFADNPFVTGDLGIRFYAGAPLKDEQGRTFGSLCVIDQKARALTAEQGEALTSLARQVMSLIKSRRETLNQAKLASELATSQRLLTRFFARESVWMGIAELESDTVIRQLYNNPRTARFFAERNVDPNVFRREDNVLPANDEWFESYRACADTQRPQSFDFALNHLGNDHVMMATVDYLGQSDAGRPQMTFSVENVTRLRSDQRLLEDQRQLVIHSSKLSSLGEMAAGMAHEINNPLAIIGGRAQEIRLLIGRGAPAEQLVNSVTSIEKTVTRISKIIKGLRSFARESSRDPLVPVKIGDVLQDTLAFCTARFQTHGVAIEMDLKNDQAEVDCRSAELSQVFLNLLNNAYDALEEQTENKWVRVQFHVVADLLEVWVTDGGPGIPTEIREKIMQPFFTTKAVDRGTGLGLSISRGIIEAHGGQFVLDENSAHTRFIIRLPLARAGVRTA